MCRTKRLTVLALTTARRYRIVTTKNTTIKTHNWTVFTPKRTDANVTTFYCLGIVTTERIKCKRVEAHVKPSAHCYYRPLFTFVGKQE